MELKAGWNWRQIFKGPEIEYCSAMKLGNLFPFYMKEINIYKALFVNKSFDCPLQPGKYYVMNWTNHTNTVGVTARQRTGVGVDIPNGIYRFTAKAFTKDDPLGGFVQWQTEVRDRFGQEDF
jgi:hypothetical protein